MRKTYVPYLILILISFCLNSCKDKKNTNTALIIRQLSDPDMLNPLNSKSDNARIINDLIFSSVNGMENRCEYDLVPILTKQLGRVSEITEGEWTGGLKIDYEIHDEAKWDNGTAITADDYIFTIKTILNPKTNCEHLKSFYDWVADIQIDPSNPKKFTVYSRNKYFKIEEFAGAYVLPEYNYDRRQIMRKFSIQDMNTEGKCDSLKSNPDIVAFAEEFNSEKFQRDPAFITGFGPYKLESWVTGQEIILKRKESWWGDNFKDLRQFWAYPKKIRIKFINDQNTAITALKDGSIDVFSGIPAKEYHELDANKEFKAKYRTDSKDVLAYSFLLLNSRNPKFSDLRVRKALAHAVNRKKINETINNGESILTESFVHPSQKTYNKNMTPYEFDLKLASQLLDMAGWIDTDGDGIRDKEIDGIKIPLTIDFKYNAGNEQRKNTALILQEDFVKLGIGFQITPKEWSVYIQDLDKLQFEVTYAAFTTPPRIPDPRQTWHTMNSGPGGDNKSGWGNEISDKIIEAIGVELDIEKRKEFYMLLQQMIHDDVPVIFLFAPKNRMAVSRNFDVEFNYLSPGFQINEFKIAN